MDGLAAVRIVRFCFGLVLLWALFYVYIRAYLLDNLRQKLFEIRDDLFDFAADGGIAFNNPCYRELRNDLNSLILFAGKLSLGRALAAYWTVPVEDVNSHTKLWVQRMEGLSPLARRKLLDTHAKALKHVTYYVVRRSLVLHLLFLILMAGALWIEAARNFYQKLPSFAEPLEAQARDEYRSAA